MMGLGVNYISNLYFVFGLVEAGGDGLFKATGQ